MRHTFVARSWGDVMWEELSISHFLNIITIGNGHKKIIFKGSGCFQFPEAVITSTVQESLCSTEHGSLQVLAVL